MVITSSTRNRVGGNTPRGFESHLLRQNKDHPSGWSLFFTEGGIRKAALRNMPVACFNRRGFSAEKESHRPDLSACSIRRDGRLLAECRWHSATAVGARRPTTSKIFNGCLPQQMESHRPDLSARSIRRDGRIGAEYMRCLCNISVKKFLPTDGISRRAAVFHAAKSRRKSAEKCRFSPVLIIIFSV